MDPLQKQLVYYAAVVKTTGNKNSTILADYEDVGADQDFAQMAAKCLEYVPPLHNSFSYTTSNRMFICLIEGLFIYCAITDEALSKAKAFLFLEHVRDAVKVLLQQRDVYPDVSANHCLHSEMNPFFTRLAASLVGIPQREKARMKELELLLQAQREAENGSEINSTSGGAPLKETSDEDFDLSTEHKRSSATLRSPHVPLIGKGKRSKKKGREYFKGWAKGSPIDSSSEALNRDKCLEIMIGDSSPHMHNHNDAHKSNSQTAKKQWCHNVKLIIVIDVVVCILFLVLWLAVCSGVKCLKKT